MKRVAESAQRLRGKLCGYSHFKLPYCLRSLRSAAASRRTKLLLLPSGMLKREKNQTRYDQRKKFISWTIEWRFHSTDVVIVDHGVHEDKNLCSVIENHLTPGPWNNQLRAFCEQLENLKLFIRKYPKGPKSPFRELDIKAPIRQQLSNIVILEYPVIYVFLPSHSYDFEVVKDSHVPNRSLLKDPINNDHQSPKGVPFKEEEIEEDIASSGTKVLDLMKHVNSSVAPQMANENRISEKALNNLDEPFLTKMVADNSSHSSQKTEEQGIFGDMEYDFDQGLIDAYSDIIAQINPDDFLDLDGIFAKEVSVEGRDGLPHFRGDNLATEELEEGEIAE